MNVNTNTRASERYATVQQTLTAGFLSCLYNIIYANFSGDLYMGNWVYKNSFNWVWNIFKQIKIITIALVGTNFWPWPPLIFISKSFYRQFFFQLLITCFKPFCTSSVRFNLVRQPYWSNCQSFVLLIMIRGFDSSHFYNFREYQETSRILNVD